MNFRQLIEGDARGPRLMMRLAVAGPVTPLEGRDDRVVESVAPEVSELLKAACSCLAASGVVRFEVGGFGQAAWPVDVETDLATVLEQVSGTIVGLVQQRADVQLDFYEQGVQRLLAFEPIDDGEKVSITCDSGSARWVPNPRTIVMSREEVVTMLRSLGDEFARLAEAACPWLARQPLFAMWHRGIMPGSGPSPAPVEQ